MNKPITINLFGGPGSGKSTTAAAVFALLKIHDVNAELITEFAKDLTWEERYRTLSNQYYVWGKQQHRMWRIKDKVDVIITDSPLVLSLIYGNEKPKCFNDTVLYSAKEGFDNMNYFLMRTKKYNPKGRNQTEDEAKELDNEVTEMLIEQAIKFKIVEGNYIGVNDITKRVLRKLNKKLKIGLKGVL